MQLNKTIPTIEVSFHPKYKNDERMVIRESQEAYEVFLQHWNMDTIHLFEEFKVLFIDHANQVIGIRDMAKGSASSVIVDTRLILHIALASSSSKIILGHNHPSKRTGPSKADDDLTKLIDQGCKTLEIKLLDHLIITDDVYYSYADEGKLN